MIKFSGCSKLNEIHIADSSFNEDLIFFQGGPNFGGGAAGKFKGKWAITGTSNSYANRGVVNFEREYQPLTPGTKILVMPQFSNMSDQILGKKEKKTFVFDSNSSVYIETVMMQYAYEILRTQVLKLEASFLHNL